MAYLARCAFGFAPCVVITAALGFPGCGSNNATDEQTGHAGNAGAGDAGGATAFAGGHNESGGASPSGGSAAQGGASVAPGTSLGGAGSLGGGSPGGGTSRGGAGALGGAASGFGGRSSSGGTGPVGGAATSGGAASLGGAIALGGASPAGGEGSMGGEGPLGEGGASAGGGISEGGASLGGAASFGGASTGGHATTGGSAGATTSDVIVTINNGDFWNDEEGNRIEAHGGGFIWVDGTWYWIGEDKSHNSGNFLAVNCYASTDLSHWQKRNAIITRDTTALLDTADRIIERPKVTYNEQTKKYVMWLHWEGQSYAEAAAGVFTSDTVDGDYTYVDSFRPNNNMSRDDTLFRDDDGTAYFISAANENKDLIIYRLSADYLTIDEQLVTLWPSSWREAPAVFKQDGRYFLITSGATGWDSNQAKYATATSMAGPWTELANLGDSTTFDTQSTFVIPVVGTKTTTYIFAADRWQDPDLVSSKYIWLPLKTNGSSLSMAYYDSWQLNVTTGQWSANDGYVSQAGWSVLYVDSQETSGEDGKAENAFDDNGYTYWHTQWEGSTPGFPHELQIDMGAEYDLTALRYLPRQDKDNNGQVIDYEFYVSLDSEAWGEAVAKGSFNTAKTEKIVTFPAKTARYLRFVALSDINGDAWASAGEIDVTGTAR